MIEQNDVAISIPFQVFANAVKSMNLQEKQALLAVLEIELAEAQEDWERDPDIQQAIRDARNDYQTGQYVTLQQYITQQAQL
jgi:hypothetical protein